jgi:hypothetical protein
MGYRVADAKRWPNRQIPYVFHANMLADESKEYRALIRACMDRWEEFINEGRLYVRFVERTNEQQYVEISSTGMGSTGSGEIGKPTQQDVSRFTLNTSKVNGRDDRDSIPHELGHVIGLAHEQQRSRPLFDQQGNPQDGTGDEADTDDPTKARLYYLGQEGRLDDKYKAMSKAAEKKKQLTLWNATYVTAGGYDLQSIMHYPDARNWQWNYAPYRTKAIAIAALNYPSAAQVAAGTWEPSIGDLYAIRELYP